MFRGLRGLVAGSCVISFVLRGTRCFRRRCGIAGFGALALVLRMQGKSFILFQLTSIPCPAEYSDFFSCTVTII